MQIKLSAVYSINLSIYNQWSCYAVFKACLLDLLSFTSPKKIAKYFNAAEKSPKPQKTKQQLVAALIERDKS